MLQRPFAHQSILIGVCLLAGTSWWAVGQEEGHPPASVPVEKSDIRAFGAVGDGKADDTDALQAAIETGSGVVQLPRGTFRITRPLQIDLDRFGPLAILGDGVARVVMAGPGPAFRFVGTHEGSADPATVRENVWNHQRAPMIDGIEIVGDHPEAIGVEATGTMQLTGSRLVIRHCLHAVHLTNRNRNIILSNCHFYENRGMGIFYDRVNLHQSNIDACHISYNGGGGIVCRGGDVRNIQVTGCDIEGNHAGKGPPTANVLIDSTGGQNGIGEVEIVGCTIQHNHDAPDSANIRILGRSEGGMADQPWFEGNVTIANNVFSDVQTNIHLKDCRGVSIVGNTFWMGFQHDLLVENSTDIVVGPNLFDRNPRYAYSDSLDADGGVVFRGCANCTLTGLHIHDIHAVENEAAGAGLLIENCRRFNITGCTVLDCEGAGIWLKDTSGSRLSDCLVEQSSVADGIRITGGSNHQTLDNLILESDSGASGSPAGN